MVLKSTKGECLWLFFQAESVFDACDVFTETLVDAQALRHLGAAVDNGAVVATSHELTDTGGGHLGVFLCKVHGYLTRNHKFVFAAAACHGCG